MVAKLATIGWFTEPWDAYIAHGRLQAEDVFSFIVHEHHIWANWMYSNALSQVKLHVFEKDVERACAVLNRHWRGEFEKELETEFGSLEEVRCPSCGATQVSYRVSKFEAVLAFGVYAAFGVAYPPRKNIGRCGTCSHEWYI